MPCSTDLVHNICVSPSSMTPRLKVLDHHFQQPACALQAEYFTLDRSGRRNKCFRDKDHPTLSTSCAIGGSLDKSDKSGHIPCTRRAGSHTANNCKAGKCLCTFALTVLVFHQVGVVTQEHRPKLLVRYIGSLFSAIRQKITFSDGSYRFPCPQCGTAA